MVVVGFASGKVVRPDGAWVPSGGAIKWPAGFPGIQIRL